MAPRVGLRAVALSIKSVRAVISGASGHWDTRGRVGTGVLLGETRVLAKTSQAVAMGLEISAGRVDTI